MSTCLWFLRRSDCLLSDLSVLTPSDQSCHDIPLHSCTPDLRTEKVEWNPSEKDGSTDAGHGAEGICVTALRDPWVGVEGKEEPEAGCVQCQQRLTQSGICVVYSHLKAS